MPTAERRKLALENRLNSPDFVFNEAFQREFLGMVQNEFLSRGAFINRWMDPRRDYNRECGYPETYELTSEKWMDYYERHPIACRVVELFPTECWQITPDLYEEDDPNVTTPFEQGFKDLAIALRGQNSYYKPEEEIVHPLWEYCKRIDILSGIGQFGVMLLGFDDGLSLNQPVDGWEEQTVGNITWNEQGLIGLQKALGDLAKHLSITDISITDNGQIVFNKPYDEEDPNVEEEVEDPKAKGNGKPIKKPTDKAVDKKITDKENMQSSKSPFPPEPSDSKGGSQPSAAAFGNINPQQGKYRDPMDTSGQNDIKPYGDQQPEFGAVETKENNPPDPNAQQGTGRKLLYIRVFPENLIQIMQYEQNMASPRFGQPTMYRVTLNDPMQQQTGVGLPLSTIEVHYSRIIHIADVGANAVSSEIFAAPRMRPVLNQLIDLQKILGACGEGYWKNAFATLAAETHPSLGGDVTIDSADLREQMKKWRDSLDRVLAATGVTWKTISPQVVDPNSYVQNELNAICIKLACPLRVFMGSEMGVLASGQDSIAWSFRVMERRKNYLTPRLIVPLIDRLIRVGVLPAPTEGYTVSWDDTQKLTPTEQAQVGGAVTGAIATYISGQCDQLIEPVTWLTDVMGWDRDKAQSAVDATMEHILKQQEMQAQQGQQMIDPMTGQPMEQDEMGQYIDPNTGEPAQTDEFGKPITVDPNTGQPMPAQQMSPTEQEGPLGAEAQEAKMGLDEQGAMQDEMGEGGQAEELGGEVPSEVYPSETGGEVDEETGLPIDPETGYLIDEETGHLIDKESGDVYDQEGNVLGNLFEQEPTEEHGDEQGELGEQGDVDEGQGLPPKGAPYPIEEESVVEDPNSQEVSQPEEAGLAPDESFTTDPQTGRLVDSDGYQLDKTTGDIFDPEGNVVGNINDDDEATQRPNPQ